MVVIFLLLFTGTQVLSGDPKPNLLAETKDFGQVDTIRLYVSPKGKDTQTGSLSSPFQSWERARNQVRQIQKKEPGKPIAVYFRSGIYPLTKPVVLENQDSGTSFAPVIYQAYSDEEPVFSGSKQLRKWAVLSDKNLLARLKPEARKKVRVCDLRKEGVTDFGDATELGARPELFCNDRLQTLARWPDSGFVQIGQVKGATPLPATYISQTGTKEGIAEYMDSYQDRWAAEKDIRLGGYWYWDWAEQFQKVERWDSTTKTFSIKPPYHHYGYKPGARYFGLNLFCEIDQPGEWYLDRETGMLYWYPPVGIDPAKADVRFTTFSAPFQVELDQCNYVTLKGLTFREGRGSAIRIRQGENCLITDCRIQRFGRDGIHVTEGKNNGISGCFLEHFGCGGIRLQGGDRKTLIPSGHFVENTIVEHFSLFKRTYEPAVHMDGCGQRISNCRFRYSSSSAFRLEGNDFLIEYNQVSEVVNESDDQGGIDIFFNPSYRGIVIQYNHWANIHGGTKHGAAGVRLDDMISGVRIFGNIFERCGAKQFGAVQIHGGKDNTVENNLFYKCPAAVSFSTWADKRWLEQLDSPLIRKKIFEDVDINSALYQSRYPALTHLRENPNVNTLIRNAVVNCDQVFLRDKGIQVQDNNHVVSDQNQTLPEVSSPAFFESLGMIPIPIAKIGPKSNKWNK